MSALGNLYLHILKRVLYAEKLSAKARLQMTDSQPMTRATAATIERIRLTANLPSTGVPAPGGPWATLARLAQLHDDEDAVARTGDVIDERLSGARPQSRRQSYHLFDRDIQGRNQSVAQLKTENPSSQ